MDIKDIMEEIGVNAKAAAHTLANVDGEAKNRGLREISSSLRKHSGEIIAANNIDMDTSAKQSLAPSMLDRLNINEDGVHSMAESLEEIASFDDPVGVVTDTWERPNGLKIFRVRVPLGVIGVIYESRPNVTVDAGGLCLKAGNAVILRGGSESFYSSSAIINSMREGIEKADLPANTVQMVPTTDRSAVGNMLTMSDYIDVIVPRGGKDLVERVQKEATVPVFAHLEGICHTYVNENSDPNMARDIVVNAKMRRTGICGATETLLIDRNAVSSHLPRILESLTHAGCEVRGDKATQLFDDRIKPATDEDWNTEYLDSIISIKQVANPQEAIDHVNTHGSQHTDAIVTDDREVAETFLNGVNSAIALHNASTQFADGREFGMGAEIGIATGKLHARGPVGIEQLTTFKYVVRGTGQVRP
ncbi:MAG TPA: glutamate-5-semialdehyde dehydrogenase [Rhodospirillales bacterium]|nr:glutamate-5-semialdehyde dehydrogenase [Rhodospirillales bacterium]